MKTQLTNNATFQEVSFWLAMVIALLCAFSLFAQEPVTITVPAEKQRGLQVIVEKLNVAITDTKDQKPISVQDYLQARINDLLLGYDQQLLQDAANDPKNQQLFQKALQAPPDVQEKIKALLESGN